MWYTPDLSAKSMRRRLGRETEMARLLLLSMGS
jgi:hypothetical protein